MKQEDKELLLQDLCARLPYNPWVLVEFEGSNQEWKTTLQQEYCVGYISGKITKLYSCEITVKPYLRPLTSMTDEEMEDYARYKFSSNEIWEIVDFKRTGKGFINVNCKNRNDASAQWTFQVKQKSPLENYRGIDWINAHHFDYRGLIEKGLALAAPEGMYN